MNFVQSTAIIAVSTYLLTACATGEKLRADVYREDQINQMQKVDLVNILRIKPVKVAVDNSENKERAQLGGALLGAISGALIGEDHGRNGATSGAGIGGVAGAIGGSMVSKETIVDGVSLIYKKTDNNDEMFNSVQIGKTCEFKEGEATMIFTQQNETRIQPNNEGGCETK